jgi:quinol monooxygenase YgiN
VELFIFGRFHALAGRESEVEAAILEVIPQTRAEPACLSVNAFHSTRDPLLFYIHSRWVDEAAFERHALLPHTVHFIERVTPLIDHPVNVTRARQIG